MARRRQNQEPTDEAGEEPEAALTAGPGHNAPDEEATFLRHVRAIARANSALEEAKAARQAVRKLAKADGIELKQLDAVLVMTDWEPGEIRDHFAIRSRYALWLGLPIGTQLDFFDAVPLAAREEIDWEARGFAAALVNRGAYADEIPADCPPDRIQAWQTGVNKAHDKIAWAMADAGAVVDRRSDVRVSAVPLEPEPVDGDFADVGPTEHEVAVAA